MDLNVDLEQKFDRNSVPSQTSDGHYPTITFTTDEDLDLPMVGKVTFVYKVLRAVSEKDETEKHTYTCTLQLVNLEKAEGPKEPVAPSTRDNSAEVALDKLMQEHEANEVKDEDED
jgi:hypothetical protein